MTGPGIGSMAGAIVAEDGWQCCRDLASLERSTHPGGAHRSRDLDHLARSPRPAHPGASMSPRGRGSGGHLLWWRRGSGPDPDPLVRVVHAVAVEHVPPSRIDHLTLDGSRLDHRGRRLHDDGRWG
jgi:hypothetical protein